MIASQSCGVSDIELPVPMLTPAEAALPGTEHAARDASAAFAEHNLALGAYTDVMSAALIKRVDIATLRESRAEQRVGLQALLGSAIPDAFTSDLNLTEAHAK